VGSIAGGVARLVMKIIPGEGKSEGRTHVKFGNDADGNPNQSIGGHAASRGSGSGGDAVKGLPGMVLSSLLWRTTSDHWMAELGEGVEAAT
jgi:hypothetical protein